ncbi:hypothetical protein [Dyella psychrodurans]|uniref:Uncharacterized protein n=1 Tax=Dyella psychrodurans TaxID=1927960 RepID=A0A370WX56_9GAMM|nr:hypothetical protein [Dyella psychrodurans]RDS80607.1 hypothetical protein DWU99_18665 [Dyella psychrodurans]
MDSSHPSVNSQACRCAFLAGAFVLALIPVVSFADGARVAQKAKPGEIVLIRNVAARPADRPPTAPGLALMVSASPNPQLANGMNGSTGSGEITDAEIADLNAGPTAGGAAPGQTNVQRSLNAALGTNSGGNSAGAVSNNGVSNLVSGATGGAGAGAAVADSTRGIGDQVTGAMSQIPMLGAGH